MMRPGGNVYSICHCYTLAVNVFKMACFERRPVAHLSFNDLAGSNDMNGAKVMFSVFQKTEKKTLVFSHVIRGECNGK